MAKYFLTLKCYLIKISAIAIATGAAKKSVGAVAVVCFCKLSPLYLMDR